MKRLHFIKTHFLLFISLLFSSAVFAETRQATVHTKFSDQEIVDILKRKYGEDNVTILEKGKIKLVANEFKHIIYNSNNNSSLSFRIYFSDPTTLADVNKWNQEKRFLTAYLDADGILVLQSDLDVETGVTEAYLLDFIKRFVLGVKLYTIENKK